ncbi:MAG: Do family serine endopeptidase [Hyphomonadaceae bacterium]|nr:Do family serine endopeptidase [Hyphomonadaceae bacterium]
MADSDPAKTMKSMLMAGAAAVAVFAGFTAAPALLSDRAEAQRIQPQSIAPPAGAPVSFADLIQRVSPAVVSISVRQSAGTQDRPDFENLPPGLEEFMKRFPERGPRRTPTALGSGFFIAEDGTIVTNNHVVADAEEIDIRLSDGRELKAELVGADPGSDLAVLKIKGGGRFPYVTFDRTPTVRVGDWVVAVGNPFGLDGTATAGIVSAKGRRDFGNSNYVDFLQLDAPINRGNSGGPAFDLKGNVIGVNSAIFSPTGGNVGIGFAIPSDTAARVVDQLISSGRVSRGWLGVQVQPVDREIAASIGLRDAKGAIVASVTPGSPAAAAGLKQGDVILTFNGAVVEDSRALTQKVGEAPINRDARLEVQRDGARRVVNVRLGERPSEQVLASAVDPRAGGPVAPGGEQSEGLGVGVRTLTSDDRRRYQIDGVEGGLVITSVTDNSVLADEGVSPGDVIISAGGKPVRSADDLDAAVETAKRQNRPVLLQVQGRTGPARFLGVEVKRG